MSREPLVSIIVNNYNYDRFIGEAIDSALAQTYQKIEVIVVDDGSTDNSRHIIAGYGDRIIPIFKENGGQASAFNAGFSQSQGEIIIFLDADDVLTPDIVRQVVELFQNNPDIAGVQYRLEIIDITGISIGAVIPPQYLPLPNGDLRSRVLELVNCSSWSPTSGQAFAASTLRKIFPMPEAPFRLSADYYLSRVNALCAPLKSLDKVGAYYRAHGANHYFTATVNVAQIRQQILFISTAHLHIRRFAELVGVAEYPKEINDLCDEVFLAQRMISYKLEPWLHPVQEDTLLSLCWRGSMAVLHRPGLSLIPKLIHLFWFWGMLIIPRPLAHVLAEQFFPEMRPSINKVLNLMQRRQKRSAVLEGG